MRVSFITVLAPSLLGIAICIAWTEGICRSDVRITNEETTCLISFPLAAVHDINTIYVPFSQVGQLIVVQARVDTFSGNFIFDTGSERLLLNSHHFNHLDGGGTTTAVGNTGLVTPVRWHTVDSLHLSPLFMLRTQAHLVDLHHIELKKNAKIYGILGYNVFQNFEVFIDFQNRVIVLSRVNRQGNRLDILGNWEQPYDSIAFDLKRHFITLETTVNDVRVKMILDSGAELNLLDRRVNRRVLDKFTILKRINLTGAGRREVEVLAGILEDVQCGNQYTKRMNTLLTSLEEINDNFGTSAQGVLGYEFLSSRRVMINYQKQKLYFFHPLRP